MSWKPEVQVVNDDKWYGNSIRFETEREAVLNANALVRRWSQARNCRATESPDPANYRWNDDKQRLEPLDAS